METESSIKVEYSTETASQPFAPAPHEGRGLTIGIRDSGVGGLTVARCVKKVLPAARLLYFADTAHVPYGEKTPAQVRHYALNIAQFLVKEGAELLIFACNTSSAIALEEAQQTFRQPVIGMIEPGAHAALDATRNRRIGVLATAATVESGVYRRTLHSFDNDIFCREIACPDFVPLVESGRTDSLDAHRAAERYLAPLLQDNVDSVVLGCTHYPLLLPALERVAPQLQFIDPAIPLAAEAAQLAADIIAPDAEYSDERDVFFASGESAGLRQWIRELMPHETHTEVREGPIFDLL